MTASTPPPMVDQLAIADFAILILTLDARRKAMEGEA